MVLTGPAREGARISHHGDRYALAALSPNPLVLSEVVVFDYNVKFYLLYTDITDITDKLTNSVFAYRKVRL